MKVACGQINPTIGDFAGQLREGHLLRRAGTCGRVRPRRVPRAVPLRVPAHGPPGVRTLRRGEPEGAAPPPGRRAEGNRDRRGIRGQEPIPSRQGPSQRRLPHLGRKDHPHAGQDSSADLRRLRRGALVRKRRRRAPWSRSAERSSASRSARTSGGKARPPPGSATLWTPSPSCSMPGRPSSCPSPPRRSTPTSPRIRLELLSRIGKTSGVPVVYVNTVGANDNIIFDGQSMVTSAEGRLLSIGTAFEEELAFVETGSARTRSAAAAGPACPDRGRACARHTGLRAQVRIHACPPRSLGRYRLRAGGGAGRRGARRATGWTCSACLPGTPRKEASRTRGPWRRRWASP